MNSREPAPGPPKGWRPRNLKIAEKLQIVIAQEGREPSGEKLDAIEGIDFDHQPPIQLRVWDEEAQDTIPPSCSLEHIVALNKATHRRKTAKVDIPTIAKVKRLSGQTVKKKGKPIPARKNPWPSRKASIQNRPWPTKKETK